MNTVQINKKTYNPEYNTIKSFLFNQNVIPNKSFLKIPAKQDEPELKETLFNEFQLSIASEPFSDNNTDLINAAYTNNSSLAKYLLTSPETKEKTDIHAYNDLALQLFIANGNFHMTQYFLTSPEINEHANIHANNEKPLIYSIQQKQYKITQYLLYSNDLEEHADIHTNDNEVIKKAIFDGDVKTIYACIDYARMYEPQHILYYKELIEKYGIFKKVKDTLLTIEWYSKLAMQYSNITNSIKLNS